MSAASPGGNGSFIISSIPPAAYGGHRGAIISRNDSMTEYETLMELVDELSEVFDTELERQRPLDPDAYSDAARVDREFRLYEVDVLLAIVRKVVEGDYADAIDNGMAMARSCATEHVRNLRY